MSEQRVLIVGGRIENVRKAKEQGLGVVYLQQPGQFTPEHASLVDAALLVDYTDWTVTEPLVAAAHRAYGFTSVVTTTEAGVEPAGRISDLLDLGGVSHEVAHLLRDKLSMRRHLAAAAPTVSVAAEEVGDRESLTAFGARHGYPFIVKPVDGIGSLGLQLVESDDQLDEVWETITRLRHSDHQFARFFPLERFLMEEYISGQELSVEAFTFEGRHVVVAVTEKRDVRQLRGARARRSGPDRAGGRGGGRRVRDRVPRRGRGGERPQPHGGAAVGARPAGDRVAQPAGRRPHQGPRGGGDRLRHRAVHRGLAGRRPADPGGPACRAAGGGHPLPGGRAGEGDRGRGGGRCPGARRGGRRGPAGGAGQRGPADPVEAGTGSDR
ncbi:hypothetical protein SCALM49S_04359 [Streptomyces californicus]